MDRISRIRSSVVYTNVLFFSFVIVLGILAGIAVETLGPRTIIAGFIFSIISVLCWKKPALYMQGLLVIALALPSGFTTTQIFSFQIGDYNVLWTDVLLVLVALRWILSRVMGNWRTKTYGPLSKCLAAIVLVLLFYSSFSIVRGLLEYGNANVVFFDARPIFYYVVILIALDYLHTQKDIERLSRSIIFGLVLYCLFLTSYFLVPAGHPLSSAMELNSWAWANRVGFSNGDYLLLASPMVLLLLSNGNVATLAKIGFYFALLFFIVVLILSMSRTMTVLIPLSIILSYVVYYGINPSGARFTNRILHLLLVSAVLLGGIYLVTDQVLPLILGESSQETLEIFVRRFDISSTASQEAHLAPRIEMFRTAVSLVLRNPLVGYGFGYQFDLKGWQNSVTFIDSSWLTVWIRLGLIGLLSLASLFAMLFHVTRRLLTRIDLVASIYTKILVASLAGSAIPLFIRSVGTSWLVTQTSVLPFLIIAGSIIGYYDNTPSKRLSVTTVYPQKDGIIER